MSASVLQRKRKAEEVDGQAKRGRTDDKINIISEEQFNELVNFGHSFFLFETFEKKKAELGQTYVRNIKCEWSLENVQKYSLNKYDAVMRTWSSSENLIFHESDGIYVLTPRQIEGSQVPEQ